MRDGRSGWRFLPLLLLPLLVLLSLLPAVSAREYCCLGPYYCEGFDTFVDARDGCFNGYSEFASSYSCSHRVNHDFCQSCCELDGERYTVFSRNQCEEGVFHFQEDCSDVVTRGRILGAVSVPGAIVDGVLVTIGEKSSLTLPDGRFALPIPAAGTFTLQLEDPLGRFSGGSRSVTITDPYQDKDVGVIPLARLSGGQTFHGGGGGATILKGYVRREGWPLSRYTVSSGGVTRETEPNGFFSFTGFTGGVTITGGGLSSPQTISPEYAIGSLSFVEVACDETQCSIVASLVGADDWSPTGDGDDGDDQLSYVDYFLPGPPAVPLKPGEAEAGTGEQHCLITGCPQRERCNVTSGRCEAPGCTDECASGQTSCVGLEVSLCDCSGNCCAWTPARPCGVGICDHATGRCAAQQACDAAAECDDANPCTQDRCLAGSCDYQPAPSGASCDGGSCDEAGSCIPDGSAGCESDADCPPGERCHLGSGLCEEQDEESPADDPPPAAGGDDEGPRCQEIHSCYQYDDRVACEDEPAGDPCGVSTYGCQWVAIPAHLDGGFCRPIDALEHPVWAPCERCEEFFGDCTPAACESIGGSCAFGEERLFQGRMTRCAIDEERACGADPCVDEIREEIRGQAPPPARNVTILDRKTRETAPRLTEPGEEGCVGPLCSFRTDDDPHPATAGSILLGALFVVGLFLLFLLFVAWRAHPERWEAFLARFRKAGGGEKGEADEAVNEEAPSSPPIEDPSRPASSYSRQVSQAPVPGQRQANPPARPATKGASQAGTTPPPEEEKGRAEHEEVFDDLEKLIASRKKK